MSNRCPQCGAELRPGERCRDRFELCLTKDYEYPASYGAVHHLIAACYMLQHNAYSREGCLEARGIVAQGIQQEATPAGVGRAPCGAYWFLVDVCLPADLVPGKS